MNIFQQSLLETQSTETSTVASMSKSKIFIQGIKNVLGYFYTSILHSTHVGAIRTILHENMFDAQLHIISKQ